MQAGVYVRVEIHTVMGMAEVADITPGDAVLAW